MVSLTSLFLFSCTNIPCNKQLICLSYESDVTITIHNNQKKLVFELQDKDHLKHNISEFSNGIIIISTPFLFNAFEFGEYDHWFPVKHKIKIDIYGDHIYYNSGNLRMFLIADTLENYDNYLNKK